MFEVFPKKEPVVFLGLTKTEWKELGYVELIAILAWVFIATPLIVLVAYMAAIFL